MISVINLTLAITLIISTHSSAQEVLSNCPEDSVNKSGTVITESVAGVDGDTKNILEDAIVKLALAIFAGLVVWGFKEYYTHNQASKRLKAGVIADINKHITGISKQVREAENIKDEFIKWGKHFPFPVNYSVARWAFYSSIQRDLPKYLKEEELKLVMEIHQFLWEMDVSFEGFTKTINSCENKELKINQLLYDKLDKQVKSMMEKASALGSEHIKELGNLEAINKRLAEK
ncbi:MAG: hypothetical protein ABJK37_10080 [Paraglaciecola sp.]|uniref:hypothetical protein n=1 Tax=Paraglaciecola sp. TaxID=1920173 RepID=UPI0032972CCA